jgi:ribonuclease G
MQHDILINWSPQETRVAVVENGAVQEIHIERSLERGLVGNVYLGKVARVLPGMQSAFIDIGMDRSAFLHVADVFSTAASRQTDAEGQALAVLPIEKQVFEGQSLLVQVIKDPIGSKGARSLVGFFATRQPHRRVPKNTPRTARRSAQTLDQLGAQGG